MKKDKRKKTNEKILAFKVKTNIHAGVPVTCDHGSDDSGYSAFGLIKSSDCKA